MRDVEPAVIAIQAVDEIMAFQTASPLNGTAGAADGMAYAPTDQHC